MRRRPECKGVRTQAEVADLLGMERSHVGQIERRALRKLKQALLLEAHRMGSTIAACYDLDSRELRSERRWAAEFQLQVAAP